MENNELSHHGIKGQKWGVRRYQNKDGSLTPLGERRRGIQDVKSGASDAIKKLRSKGKAAIETAKQRKAEADKKRADEAAKKEREAREAAERDRAERRAKALSSTDADVIYKNRDVLTTAEINERLNRLDTERRLADAAARTKKSGMEYVDQAIKIGRKANEIYELTNSPLGKAVKKSLGLTEVESRLPLKEVYALRDTLPDKALSDALKRANTEKAIKKIIDEDEGKSSSSQNSKENTKSSDKESDAKTSSSKSERVNAEFVGYRKTSHSDPIDAEWTEVKTSNTSDKYYDAGYNFVTALLEESKK